MERIKLLTARHVNTLPTGFHSDGGNLYLRVRQSGSRAWVFRYKVASRVSASGKTKVNEIGLGPVADDGRMTKTTMTQKLVSKAGVGSVEELVPWLYAPTQS